MGDPLAWDKDARYERTLEYIKVVRQLWIQSHGAEGSQQLGNLSKAKEVEPVTFQGKHVSLEGGVSYPPPIQRPHPPFYFGGSSPAAQRTAAEIADVYLMWAEPLDWIREQIEEVEHHREVLRRTQGLDRPIRYGLRAQVVIRDSEEEAWAAARLIISKADPAAVQEIEHRFAQAESEGQQRQNRVRRQAAGGQPAGMEVLEGEIAVDLDAAGAPFLVRAGAGTSVGRAGSFQVKLTEGRSCVTCLAGTVRVEHPAGVRVLAARQQVSYDGRQLADIAPVTREDALAWRQGMLVFRRDRLADVIAEINRYRAGRVVLLAGGLDDSAVSGRFSIKALDAALLQIQHSFALTARALPGGIVLLS